MKKLIIACTLFVKIKKCVFIFVCDKKAFDCKMIERPEKLISALVKLIERMGETLNRVDISFAPRVTSISPDKIPVEKLGLILSELNNKFRGYDKILKMLRSINISEKQ